MPNCRDWYAWYDRMPGPGSTPALHVTRTCEFNTARHSADLERREPKGTDPKDLLLELVVREPCGGVAAPALTGASVSYSEETSIKRDTASIVGVEVGMTVQETS